MTDENEETQEQETPEEPETFSREYVAELRQEAAENRVKAKQATQIEAAFRDAALQMGCAGVLVEPLEWRDEFNNDDGLPDQEKIRAAAEALAVEKPHLARVRQEIPQGSQEDSAPDALAAFGQALRAGI